MISLINIIIGIVLVCIGLGSLFCLCFWYKITKKRNIREEEQAFEALLAHDSIAQTPIQVMFRPTQRQRVDITESYVSFPSYLLPGLTPMMSQLQYLNELSLGGNQMTSLPTAIFQLHSLKKLLLGYNYLTDIPPDIHQLTSLESLYLYNNQFSSFPVALIRLTSLKRLDLSSNQITDLPPLIGELSSLCTLNMPENRITALPSTIGQLQSLEELWLSRNKLETLPSTISQLTSLRSFWVDSNELTDIPAKSIANCSILQELRLTSNKLQTIHFTIGFLPNLRMLNISKNPIKNLPLFLANKFHCIRDMKLSLDPSCSHKPTSMVYRGPPSLLDLCCTFLINTWVFPQLQNHHLYQFLLPYANTSDRGKWLWENAILEELKDKLMREFGDKRCDGCSKLFFGHEALSVHWTEQNRKLQVVATYCHPQCSPVVWNEEQYLNSIAWNGELSPANSLSGGN